MPAAIQNERQGPSMPPVGDNVRNPNESLTEKAVSPIATISSHSDPWPHYIAAIASGTASTAAWLAKPPNKYLCAVAGFASIAYAVAGRQVVTGDPKLGYDLGTITSIGLAAATGSSAMKAGADAVTVSLATIGGISTVANGIKSYQMRTGKPRELESVNRK